MPLETALAAISGASALGLEAINLNGCAPMQYPQWDALIAAISTSAAHLKVETNATQLRKRHDLAQLETGQNYELVAGFDQLCQFTPDLQETLMEYARAGWQITAAFRANRANQHEIAAMIERCESAHVNGLLFIVSPPPIQATAGQNGWLHVEEWIALGRRVECEMAPKTRLRLMFDYPPVFRGLSPNSITLATGGCSVLNTLSILPDGKITVCSNCSGGAEWTIGSVPQDSMTDLWNKAPLLLALREGLPARLNGVCASCTLRDLCLGGCVIDNHARAGSLWGPYWFCKEAEQAQLFPEGRREDV